MIDQSQREQALDHQQSFIVQAPAGSGKTELLIQRYLVLLAHVERLPEQVIAITFTKKAALEMRTRVLQALTAAQQEPCPELLHRQKTWHLAREVLTRDARENWQLLKQPHRLNMLTIDSFCASLTRKMPLISRFGAMPEIIENADEFYQQAAELALSTMSKNPRWEKSMGNILWHFDNQLPRIQRLIAELLAKREQWLDYVGMIDHQQIELLLKKNVQHLIDDALLQAAEQFPEHLQIQCIELFNFAAHQCIQYDIPNENLKSFAHCTQLPEPRAKDLKEWKAITQFILTNEGTIRKQVDRKIGFLPKSEGKTAEEKQELIACKEWMLKFLGHIAEYPELLAALQHIQQLPAVAVSPIVVDFLEILAVAAAELMVLFQQKGSCDFNQLLQGALYALGTTEQPSDLALTLDYRIQHILVDEFQDTSVAQFRLLERLTAGWSMGDNRTLFLVGDPMQSIYRFRQAEVGLFLTAWRQGLGDIPLTPLVLQANFRSSEVIVAWINQHMSTAFPAFSDIGVGAVPFAPAYAQQKISDSSVNLYMAEDQSAEAQYILGLIKNALADPSQEKIAILVRARSHALEILSALQAADIPYHAVEMESLNHCAVLQDLWALTRALLNPDDKLAWLAILRAPFCALTLKELTCIVEVNPDACVLDNLSVIQERMLAADSIETDFSESAQQIILQVTDVMKQALAERQRHSVSLWVLGVWQALNASRYYADPTILDVMQRFFLWLESLGTDIFYCSPTKLEKKMGQLYLKQMESSATRVQVMTMHKAKGLEFDTVIIPSLQAAARASDRPLLAWWERPSRAQNAELLMAALPAVGDAADGLYEYIWTQQKRASDLEATRVLYVAMTRAKKHLHMTFTKIEAAPPANSLLKWLWPTVCSEVTSIANFS